MSSDCNRSHINAHADLKQSNVTATVRPEVLNGAWAQRVPEKE
jgi:hypothetical protein